jgi:hypothetical protein
MESYGGITLTGVNRRTLRITCHSATLSTTNPTWTDLGVNTGLRGQRPTVNHLNHGTALYDIVGDRSRRSEFPSRKKQGFSSRLPGSGQIWVISRILSSGSNFVESEAYHLIESSAEIKDTLIFTAIPTIHLHGIALRNRATLLHMFTL